jgi:aldose 1-epimerase
MKKLVYCLSAGLLLFSCSPKQAKQAQAPQGDTCVKMETFNKTVEGKLVNIYTLKNAKGMELKLTNFGARIVSVMVPDKNNNYADVTLGFATLDQYLGDKSFAGSVVGRYANRIANAKFSLDGKSYTLAANDKTNALHGGVKGFDKVIWTPSEVSDSSVLFTYVAADMEEGYPGNLTVKVRYTLSYKSEMVLAYEATSDKKTVLNLTNHVFFNMAGASNGDILGQELQINSDAITPVDTTLIPTGKLMTVKGTPFDFDSLTVIGKRIGDDHPQLKCGMGYDHNYVLRGEGLKFAAKLKDKTSGRVMELWTTEPGVQFYSGNFFNSSFSDKQGKTVQFRSFLALEPQHFPNSPNTASFPSTVLEPGKTYTQTSIYKFYVE